MRIEGLLFIIGNLGFGIMFAWPVSCRRRRILNLLPLGKIFASIFFFMDVSRVNLRRYSIVIRVTTICCARNMMCFVAQAQSFVGSADCCAIPLGLGFGESYFWGVGCGRAIRICISGCGIEVRFS